MRIGFCAMYGERWIAGLHYLECLLGMLRSLPESERPGRHLLLRRNARSPHTEPLERLVESVQVFDRTGPRPRRDGWRLWEGRSVALAEAVERAGVDVVYPLQQAPALPLPVPWIGWVPDFQHLRLPEFFDAEERAGRDRRIQSLVDAAACVVVSSEDARQDLMRHYRITPERVAVCRFGPVPVTAGPEEEAGAVCRAFGLPRKFLYFPSQSWKHKNHLGLFRAIRLLKEQGVEDVALVLTGHQEDFRFPAHAEELRDYIRAHGLGGQIRHLGLLARADQLRVLRAATAVVQPSFFEGWSMLVEECRAWGKRVYLSDIPVHREQDPPRASYFDPHDPEQLAAQIRRDWAELAPGPEPAAEAAAAEASHTLARERARHLLGLFASV